MLHQEIIMKTNKQHILIEYIGWIGVLLIIASYGLIALGVVDGNSLVYHGLILAGSMSVGAISLKKRAFQPAVLNILFTVLAIAAIARILLA